MTTEQQYRSHLRAQLLGFLFMGAVGDIEGVRDWDLILRVGVFAA